MKYNMEKIEVLKNNIAEVKKAISVAEMNQQDALVDRLYDKLELLNDQLASIKESA